MQVNDYQKAAMATLNPALEKKDVLINSVMGLCGESGEAIDIVKKWLMQGHALHHVNVDLAIPISKTCVVLTIPLFC